MKSAIAPAYIDRKSVFDDPLLAIYAMWRAVLYLDVAHEAAHPDDTPEDPRSR